MVIISIDLKFVLILKVNLLILVSLLSMGLNAQDTTLVQQKDKKIALVLSGGSAHGLAHIGVIKYLEEIGIQPDIITGTSMGAVIGGLYAMGYTSDQLEEIASSRDWDMIMSNKTPLNEIAPIEKPFHERIPLSLYWKNDSFKLPAGIIRGQRLDIMLSSLFIGSYSVNNFDELFIPFRCVAVDLEDGSVDVFGNGYLADAIRASMAIPSVFPPKEINGTLYVDGGLIRNFPVAEAKDLGADIVIGVYVGSMKTNRNDLISIVDILEQSAFMGSMLDSEVQSENLDVLIKPRVKKMGKFDFYNWESFVEKGYQAAELHHEELQKIKGQKLNPTFRICEDDCLTADSITIDQIYISNQNKIVKRLIEQKLRGLSEEKICITDLEKSLALIYGTKNFSKTSYSFEIVDSTIQLNLYADEVDPYNIGLSLNRFKRYNSAVILNAEARNKLGRLSNVRVDARISENAGLQFQYYNRLASAPTYLFRFYSKIEAFRLPFINNDVVDRLYGYRDGDVAFEIIKEWRNSHLFGLGYKYEFDRIKADIFKANDIKRLTTRRQSLFASIAFNDLNKQTYADNGTKARLDLSYVFNVKVKRENQSAETSFLNYTNADKYFKLDFSIDQYISLSHRFCIELGLRARTIGEGAFLDHFRIGGTFQEKNQTYGFIGLEDAELLISDHISIKGGLRYYYNDLLYITPTIQYMYGEDMLSYAYERDKYVSMLGMGLQFGVDSPIGPVSFDVGYTNLTDEINLNLGIGFRHIY